MIRMNIRPWLAGIAAAGALCGAPLQAAEWAPSQPVHIIVPITGSTNDLLARLMAPHLEQIMGQPFIVENRPGAGGNIGADYVARATPDGHTLLIGYNGPIAINKSLFSRLPYDPQKDLAPISLAVMSPQYLVVRSDLPVSSVDELVRYAKEHPGELSYGSVAVGSASHLTMEMLKLAAGIDIVHVPYKGAAPALVDLVAGNVDVAFMVPGNVQPYMADGRLRAIASSGLKRFASTPDVPTVAESGFPDFNAVSWIGLLAPGGTPPEIIERYNQAVVRVLRMPEVRQRLEDIEFDVVATSSGEFAEWIAQEIPRWGEVIEATGARVD